MALGFQSHYSRPLVMPKMGTRDARAVELGGLVKEKRLDLGLNRPAFVREMARHGEEITPDYLNKIESGTASLARASLEVREAIRAVLGYDSSEWQQATGLYTSGNSDIAPLSPRRGPPIPPVVEPLQLPLDIPAELQLIIDKHGDDYPELHNATTLRALTAPRLFAGHSQGPQTADQWLEYFLMNRRWFPQ